MEEVVVLVDMRSRICSTPCWAHVFFQTPALLLAPCLASIPVNVQGFSTSWTRRVLFEPRAQARAVNTHKIPQKCYYHISYIFCFFSGPRHQTENLPHIVIPQQSHCYVSYDQLLSAVEPHQEGNPCMEKMIQWRNWSQLKKKNNNLTCGRGGHRAVCVLSAWYPSRWHNHHH